MLFYAKMRTNTLSENIYNIIKTSCFQSLFRHISLQHTHKPHGLFAVGYLGLCVGEVGFSGHTWHPRTLRGVHLPQHLHHLLLVETPGGVHLKVSWRHPVAELAVSYKGRNVKGLLGSGFIEMPDALLNILDHFESF